MIQNSMTTPCFSSRPEPRLAFRKHPRLHGISRHPHSVIATPVPTCLVGRRRHCSWECGFRGLMEPPGDPFRRRSGKSFRAWRIEQWPIHSFLLLVVGIASVPRIDTVTDSAAPGPGSPAFASIHGDVVRSAFSGRVGAGCYPLQESPVLCRCGRPLAVSPGFSRCFSRFRRTTEGENVFPMETPPRIAGWVSPCDGRHDGAGTSSVQPVPAADAVPRWPAGCPHTASHANRKRRFQHAFRVSEKRAERIGL